MRVFRHKGPWRTALVLLVLGGFAAAACAFSGTSQPAHAPPGTTPPPEQASKARAGGAAAPREAFDLEHARETARFLRLAGHAARPVRELPLPHGLQCVGPPYDRSWGTGTGWPLARLDGSMTVVGSNGFSASGIGMHLHAEDDGFVSVFPKGYAECTWVNLGDAIRLRSRAGAGAADEAGAKTLIADATHMNMTGRGTNRAGQADQINPTSWNFASTISRSNGFMMYSLAPACSARAI